MGGGGAGGTGSKEDGGRGLAGTGGFLDLLALCSVSV